MKEVVEKLSSYNLLNYLLPGVVYSTVVAEYTSFNLVLENLFAGAFMAYFVGMTISRIGSLLIQPIIKKWGKLSSRPYSEYVKASKKDSKIDILSEQNNTYRTMIALILAIALTIGVHHLALAIPKLTDYMIWILLALLLVLFFFAYRKQTKYITDRIDANLDDE